MQKKTKKILAWIFLPILALILLFFLLIPVLENYVEKRIDSKLGGAVQYDSLHVSALEQSVYLKNVRWVKTANEDTVQIATVSTCELKDLGLFSFLFGKKNVGFEEVKLKDAALRFFASNKDTASQSSPKPKDLLNKKINQLKIKKLIIDETDLQWYDHNGDVKSKISGINFSVDDLLLDSSSAAKNNGWFSFQNFSLEAEGSMTKMKKKLHQFTTGKITISSENQSLKVDSLQVTALYSKNELAHQYGYQTNWMDVSTENLKLNGFDLRELLFYRKFIASHADLNGLKYHAFRDKELDYHPDRKTSLPQLAFKKMPLHIAIDTFSIQNAYFEYEERMPPATENGVVYFANADIAIANLSNTSTGEIKMHATADLYDQSRLTADFSFPMDNENGLHYVSGSLAEMDIKTFNQTFEPLAGYRVESGRLHELSFDFNADLTSSEGKLNISYSNLKLQLLNKGGSNKTPLLKEFASVLANTVVINNDNRDKSAESSSKANISYKRHTKKSILNYWWKSIFSGIKSTVMNMDVSSKSKKKKE